METIIIILYERAAGLRPTVSVTAAIVDYIIVTLMTFDKQSNGRPIEVES